MAALRRVARAPRPGAPSTRRWPSSPASAAAADENVMEATIAAARAGATTGEWAQTLRDVFGDYRAPTGRGRGRGRRRRRGPRRAARAGRPGVRGTRPAAEDPGRQAGPRRPLQRRRADRGARARRRHGRGLRGDPPHPVPDRRLRPAGGRARGRPVDPLGLAPRADPGRRWTRCATPASRRRWSSGGSSPRPTRTRCAAAGVAAVYTPKDFDLNRIMRDIVELVAEHRVGAPRTRRERGRAAEPGAELGQRLRERDLSAAPAVLNLVENRAPGGREEVAALLREVAPAALGGGGRRRTSSASPGRRASASPRCCRELVGAWRRAGPLGRGAGRRPDLAALGRARCSATARGSPSTRPTRACSSARRPPAGSSAAWPRPRAPRLRRWRRRSTWS